MEQTQTIDRELEEAKKIANHLGLDVITLKNAEISIDALELVPEDIARKYQIVAYKKEDKKIFLAASDPQSLKEKAPQILIDLKKKGFNFVIGITTKSDLMYALLSYKQKRSSNNLKQSDIDNKIEKVSLKGKNISYDVLTRIPEKIANKYQFIVFEEENEGNKVKVGIVDPENLQTQEIIDFIKNRNGIEVDQYKISKEDFDWAIRLYAQEPNDIHAEGAVLDSIDKPVDIKETSQDEQNNKTIQQSPSIVVKQNIADEKNKQEDDKLEDTKDDKEPAEKIKSEIKPVIKETKDEVEDKVDTIKVSNEYGVKKSLAGLVTVSESDQNLDRIIPNGVKNAEELVEIAKTGYVPKIVAGILYYAANLGASDVHLEPSEKFLNVRFRMDGVLKLILKMAVAIHAPIVSRIKILSKLKIDEQRVPQDGRFDVIAANRSIDLRVSTLPTVHGEKCVMRLLDKTTGLIELEKLGLQGKNLDWVNEAINKPYGTILVTGPTGSGKTTTLYAVLNKLNKEDVNIVTLEDPVEYDLPGISQCQVKQKIGFSFADGLRSILRQDPNIIMVGEVRDAETATMVTHAALTGHLVLSTLHTNDSAGALPRLIDMGVEPYLITSSINAIVAQRLVRKLCDKCKAEVKVPDLMLNQIKSDLQSSYDAKIKEIANNELKFYKPVGCSECKDGYKGRLGLYEVLYMDERIEQLAVTRATASAIKRASINNGLITLRQDGYVKALEGLTSLDEVMRVTSK